MVVPTVPRVEGVPIPVQYAKPPIFGVVEVPTFPAYRVDPSNPSSVPVQSPVVFKLKAFPEYVSPVPAVVVAPEYIVPFAETAREP